jgi:hypothetical protein
VDDLNDSLAEIMQNMTQRIVNKKMLENENAGQDEAVIFAKQCTMIAADCAVEHRELLDYWFLWLGTVIQKEWTCAIKEVDSEDLLEEHVDEKDVDSVLEGSQGTVFYISGYLLRALMKVRTKDDQSGIRKFVDYNSFDHLSQDKENLGLPTHVVNSREIHKGAMKRVCPLFFRFVCLMEALYKVNLTPAVAAAFRQDFFRKVDGLVRRSRELADLFNGCIPENCTGSERELIEKKLYRLILQKYGSLCAQDVLRNLKSKTSARKAVTNLSTRAAVAVSIDVAGEKLAMKGVNEINDYTADARYGE